MKKLLAVLISGLFAAGAFAQAPAAPSAPAAPAVVAAPEAAPAPVAQKAKTAKSKRHHAKATAKTPDKKVAHKKSKKQKATA